YCRGTAKSLTRSCSLRTTYQQTIARSSEKTLRYRLRRRLKRILVTGSHPSGRAASLRRVRPGGGRCGARVRRVAAAQVAAQERPQRGPVERTAEDPVHRAADRAALLRDHDHDAVVLF